MRQSLLNHQTESRSCEMLKTWQANAVTRILIACFAMLLMPQGLWAQQTNGKLFSGGSGTYQDPFIIKTPSDLKDLSTYVNTGMNTTNVYFNQMRDIDCSNLTDFEPIGNATYPFLGTLECWDGTTQYIISNLNYTSTDATADVGLFGVIGVAGGAKGIASHVRLEDCKFGGGKRNGAIVGYLANGNIYNCDVIHCEITSGNANNPQSGGLAGVMNDGGWVPNCQVYDCTIKASTNNSSTSEAGGLIGHMNGGELLSNLIHSYQNGNGIIISSSGGSSAYAGTIVGFYASGTFGSNTPNGNYSNSYYYNVSTQTTTSGGTVEKTGNMPRGIGNHDDLPDQVFLADQRKLTLAYDATEGVVSPKPGTYYRYDAPDCYAASNTSVTIMATPNMGFKPRLGLSNTNISFKEVDINDANGNYAHTEFTFTVPYADMTATVSFVISAIDLSSTLITLAIDDATYSPTASLVPTKVILSDPTGATRTLNKETDFTITGYTLNGGAVSTPKNAGTYTVTIEGKGNYSGTRNVSYTIKKAAGSISYAATSVSKTYGDAAFTNALTNTGDGTVTYTSNNTAVATVNASTGSVTIVGNGTATITATVADGTNYTYATKTVSYTLSVGTAAMNVTATGYTGTYDGQAHGITVNAPAGATVKYGTAAGTYNLTTSPTYTNAGNYTVYYQVTKAGFTDVTGSQTIAIAKAAGSISFTTASIDKLDNDAAFTNALTKTGDGTVTYTSSDTNVATVNATTGEVTIVGVGSTTITATVADGTNYTYATKTATYTINVAASIKKYDLWIGNTQVTEANMNDVLGDNTFLYVPSVNMLFITNSNGGQRIENRMKEGLKIYLAPSSENKVKDIVSTIPALLTITTDGNYPGRLELQSTNNVIQGFSALNLEENLSILEPDNAEYWNLVLPAKNATIGIVIEPMVQEEILELGDPELSNNSLENYVYDGKMLITLKDTQSPDGDGMDDSGTPCIVLNNVVPEEVFNNLDKDDDAPGSQSFASMFTGLTILVPGGEGWILIDAETHDGYCIKLRSLFGKELEAVMTTSGERTTQAFHYEFDEPTFVGIYNGGVRGNAAREKAIRPGRKTVGHIKVYTATVSPGKVNAANPAGVASGGLYTGPVPAVGQDVDNPTVIESGIQDIKTQVNRNQNDRWYNLNGQQINEPQKKGLYIHNGKKVIYE